MHVMVAGLLILASDKKAQAFSTERQGRNGGGNDRCLDPAVSFLEEFFIMPSELTIRSYDFKQRW
jgi:hypothetical protein